MAVAIQGQLKPLGYDIQVQQVQDISAQLKDGNFEASMAQDFNGIGTAAADAVARVLGGETLKQHVIYVPTKLVTSANAKE